MSEVILSRIGKRFLDCDVVCDLSLTIREGEFLTLLGPSGCGKSTTLNMIAGLESITTGELLVGGKRYNDIPARHRNIGMVFQSYALFPHMTVDQNIAFGLRIQKRPRTEIFEKVDWAKTLLHLEDKGPRHPRELSGGERQRVALGRALVLNPQVLLLDEPLSNLDQELRETMTTELKRIHQRVGCTMIYVTHNQMEAMRMSDRIAVLKDGRLMQCDAPMDIFNRPANRFTATFLGSPAMNLYPARIVCEDGEARVDMDGVRFKLENKRSQALLSSPGRELVAGIRPQQIYYLHEKQGRRHSDTDMEVTVSLVEPVGERLMVTARFGSRDMVFFVVSDRVPAIGEKMHAVIDGRHVHLFDKESGERITDGE